MGFLAPLMLIGAAAGSIPLILHFFYRARYKPVPWGAMKFLRLAVEQTSRRLRFQELILLLLRRSEEHTSELQSPCNLVCRLLLEKKTPDRLDGAAAQVP